MTDLEQEIAAVTGAIVAAFPISPAPPADSLTWLPNDYEAADIRAAFGGRRWTEVPDYHVARSDSALGAFSDHAFHYYLPAYLTWLLADPAQRRYSNASEAITHHLLPLANSDRALWRRRRALFTPAQITAVARWLHLVYWQIEPERKRTKEILRYYQKYWKPHLPAASHQAHIKD
jgi:hypothetical protein